MRFGQRRQRVGPRLGVALGGGGVRGFAHVGVLRVMREEGISIDLIAGISMGAIVAAAFALDGDFLDEDLAQRLEGLRVSPVKSLAQRVGVGGWWARLRRLVEAERFMVDNLVWWGVAQEATVERALSELTAGRRLEEGRIPVAVVACDLISGAPVVFRTGPAAVALRASTALPGFLPPVVHGDQVLADGGFVGMVPTAALRDMGADIVVAVDADPPCAVSAVRNGLDALLRALEICSQGHKEARLREADLVIRPAFGETVGALDFSQSARCLEAGVRAGREAVPAIRALLRERRPGRLRGWLGAAANGAGRPEMILRGRRRCP